MTNRYFFALDIAENDKNTIAAWQMETLNLNFKVIPKDNFHITLCFLGAVSEDQYIQLIKNTEKISCALRPISETTLHLNYLGLFKKPKVLYLGNSYTPPWLLTLSNELCNVANSLSIFQENRSYTPHISIYRKAKAILPIKEETSLYIKINSFSLYKSISSPKGVKYIPVQRWQLA